MKKIALVFAVLSVCTVSFAQDAQSAAADAAAALSKAEVKKAEAKKPVYWKTSAVFDLGFNQTGLTNWAAGGYSTMALAAGIDAKANYAKNLTSWSNRLQLNYGLLYSADKKGIFQKSNDRIYLESKLAYKTGKSKWNYTASFDFRSQFSDTPAEYRQDTDGDWYSFGLKSAFNSPAYTNLALGMEWKPNDWFNVNIAPLTGGFTIVSKDELRSSYGMKLKDDGVTYRSALFQFGAQIKLNAKAVINNAFSLETQLVMFTDYLNNPFTQNRVNWDNKISWQLSKLFKIGLDTWLIYDPLVNIDGKLSKIQFKEFFSINFTYSILGKK